MRKISIILSLALFTATTTLAQEAAKDTSWKVGGMLSVTYSQVSLTNWSAGGDNTMSLSALGTFFANYKKGKFSWDNGLLLGFGETRIADGDFRKNDDRIELQSKPGLELKKHWYLSYLLNIKTQFSAGYNYDVPSSVGRIKTSDFLAPAYMINALGIEYKPNDNFYLFLSPVTVKSTIVNVDDSEIPHINYNVDSDKTAKNEFGFYLSCRYKKEIMKNVALATKIDLFSNYSENPQNVDVNWDVLIAMKVNKFITASLSTSLIYDDNVAVPKKKDGVLYAGKGTQFREMFGVGFAYNFGLK